MNLTEEIKKILQESNLSEETFTALAALVEGHVTKRLEEQEAKHLEEAEGVLTSKLEEQHAFQADEYKTQLKEQNEANTKKIDGYVETVVQEFIAENKKSFEQLEDYDRMQKAFKAICESMEGNGFPINKDANAQKALQEATEAKAAYTTLFDSTKLLEAEIDKLKREACFATATKGLADTQVEKVVKLAENVQFASVEEMTTGLKLIVEQVSKTAAPPVEAKPPVSAPKNTLMESALTKL